MSADVPRPSAAGTSITGTTVTRNSVSLPMFGQDLKRRTAEYVPGQQEAGVVLTSLADMLTWAQNYARSRSIWPLGYGLACCAIEMIAAAQSHYDLSRWGSEVFRSSPTPGRPDDRRRARSATRWGRASCASMSRCPTLSGCSRSASAPPRAASSTTSYYTVQGVDTLVPVDIYVPGCPPRPEALIEGILKLREKIEKQGLKIRGEE